jgi:ubiquitin carboxyl-terminal hydrolase 25/28
MRQRDCNTTNRPYYLDCAREILEERSNSEQLQTVVAMAVSEGEYGQKEIDEAYSFFCIDPDTLEDDEYIIGQYKSRISDAPRQKAEAARCLGVIGWARNSNKIIAASKERNMSPKEAYDFLGDGQMGAGTPSEMIEAQAIVKVCGSSFFLVSADSASTQLVQEAWQILV